MTLLKTISLGITGVLTTGATTITGIYHSSKETIGFALSEDIFPIDNLSEENTDSSIGDVWTSLKSQLSSKETQIKTQGLKDIKEKQAQDLKKWCFETYDKTYKSIFHDENEDLKEDAKIACVLPIKTKLKDNDLLKADDETQKDEFEKNMKTLKEGKLDNRLVLEQGLIEAKSDNSTDNWKKLKEWCKGAYERGYQGESSNRVKLVNKFCKKSAQA